MMWRLPTTSLSLSSAYLLYACFASLRCSTLATSQEHRAAAAMQCPKMEESTGRNNEIGWWAAGARQDFWARKSSPFFGRRRLFFFLSATRQKRATDSPRSLFCPSQTTSLDSEVCEKPTLERGVATWSETGYKRAGNGLAVVA